MSLIRALVQDAGGLGRNARAGDGYTNALLTSTISPDSNQVITAANISGGVIIRSGATAARTDTTDTAVALAAAFPNMDVGDSLEFLISVSVAFAITIAGGVGVTASGNLVVAANAHKHFLLTKTAAATFNLIGL